MSIIPIPFLCVIMVSLKTIKKLFCVWFNACEKRWGVFFNLHSSLAQLIFCVALEGLVQKSFCLSGGQISCSALVSLLPSSWDFDLDQYLLRDSLTINSPLVTQFVADCYF